VPAYGTAVTIKGTTYYYIIDTKAQVRELLLGATAPIDKVVVQEETRGLPHRELSAQEILDIVLDHQEEDTDSCRVSPQASEFYDGLTRPRKAPRIPRGVFSFLDTPYKDPH
jgi:hypothetical protein